MNRRQFTMGAAGCASALVLTLAGCAGTPAHSDFRNTEEKITSVMISPDGKKLVVFGKRFHYVFDNVTSLNAVLSASFRPQLRGSFEGFEVDRYNRIKGTYRLTLAGTLTQEQRGEAIRLGFAPKADVYEFVGTVDGRRYTPSAVKPTGEQSKLNQEYTLSIREETNYRPPEPSPVSQLGNGVLMIFAIPLILIMIFTGGICTVCK